jgi:ABC-type phosphate/phosphonate transport system substrate-binding protein
MGRRVFAVVVGLAALCLPLRPAAMAENPITSEETRAATGFVGNSVEEALSFGVIPHHSLIQLEAFYAPLAMYLGEQLGRSVRFGTSSSYARFHSRVRGGDFDLIVVQARDYAKTARAVGYRPLVRLANPTAGVLIVAESGPIRELADLRGQGVALPPEESETSAAAIALLTNAGLLPARDVTVVYVPQHNACLQHVLTGRVAACATVVEALMFAGLREGRDYRIVAHTEPIPPPLVAAAPRVSTRDRELLTAALLAWPRVAGEQGGPADLDWLKLAPASDSDFGSSLSEQSGKHDQPDPERGS